MKTFIICLMCLCSTWGSIAYADSKPMFPVEVTKLADDVLLFANKGSKSLDFYSVDKKAFIDHIDLDRVPTGMVVSYPYAYVSTFDGKGELVQVDLNSKKVIKSVEVGSGACSPLLSMDEKSIFVCNQFSSTIDEIDIDSFTKRRSETVLREPKSAIVSPDGKYLYVANFLPAQRADLDIVASCVSVIDLASFKKIKDIQLANGSNALRDICITPDGRYIYVSHNLGRFTVPTSQLQQGWMNTSAFSVIDASTQNYLGAIVVDEPDMGAAGIWSIESTPEHIFITHSGTHEVSVIDHKVMLDRFNKYPDRSKLDYDLRFLYGIRQRVKLNGNGPRSFILDNDKLIIPTYFADELNYVDIANLTVTSTNLNPNRTESVINKGEKYFNDAALCYQGWQSCNGCHPGDARTDAMNWDLMNDGVGNSKNCKSLLFSHVTPPSMISGIRASAEIAVRKGYNLIQFHNIEEEKSICVDEYLKSLRPVPSPYLIDGELSPLAKEGRKIFEEHKCGHCHSGPMFTDMKTHRIGDDIEFEQGWDTPTLREVWRTAPYLFDGRAATMRDVFEEHKHGISKRISKKDMDALVEYVNSL